MERPPTRPEVSSGELPPGSADAVLTVPNALSALRILLIPVFSWLIVHRGTEVAGLAVFGAVSATDWVDGWIARRTGRVSELGKVLDPAADRLALGAGLVAMVLRDAFPLWAALLILVRDGALLVVGAVVLARWRIRIDVRRIGKVATFTLMVAVPAVAWGNLELPLAGAASAIGWLGFAAGLAGSYGAAVLYVGDLRRAMAGVRDGRRAAGPDRPSPST